MITVYLDSQDYSVLSDESTITDDLRKVRDELKRHARDGRVRFVFSSIAICEAAPTSPQAIPYAIDRAALLSELCGSNALIDFSSLCALECRALTEKSEHKIAAIDSNGNWFPNLGLDEADPPDIWGEMLLLLRKDATLTREQKRAVERKMFKNGNPTTEAENRLRSIDLQILVQQVMAKYPMKQEDSGILIGYWLGTNSASEYSEAMHCTLRDPQWMMKWFSTYPDLAAPIARIVREPGEKMNAMARMLIDASRKLARHIEETSGKRATSKGGEMERMWREALDVRVCNIVRDLCKKVQPPLRGDLTATDIARFCPGLNAILRSAFSSYWDNVCDPKKALPLDSQFVDAMHALYAPYVDVFRADSYMEQHIQRQVKSLGTVVVPKLRNLPAVINSRLSIQGST